MAGTWGDYLENEVLDHVFGGSAYSAPSNLYFGLSSTDPGDDGSGVTEPSGGSYARVNMANNLTNFPAAVGGAKSNGVAITFPTATASWGSLGYFCIFDAASGGNFLGGGSLAAPKTIDNGDTAEYAIGDFDFTLA
jgi:hypothetical protein